MQLKQSIYSKHKVESKSLAEIYFGYNTLGDLLWTFRGLCDEF